MYLITIFKEIQLIHNVGRQLIYAQFTCTLILLAFDMYKFVSDGLTETEISYISCCKLIPAGLVNGLSLSVNA